MAVTVTVIQLRLTSSHPLSYVTCLAFNVPFHRLRLPGDGLPLTTTLFLDTLDMASLGYLQPEPTVGRLILGYVSWEDGGRSCERRPRTKSKHIREKIHEA